MPEAPHNFLIGLLTDRFSLLPAGQPALQAESQQAVDDDGSQTALGGDVATGLVAIVRRTSISGSDDPGRYTWTCCKAYWVTASPSVSEMPDSAFSRHLWMCWLMVA